MDKTTTLNVSSKAKIEEELEDSEDMLFIPQSKTGGNMYKENSCGTSFSADQDYQDQFLDDIYNPDEYRTRQNFCEKFYSSLQAIINKHKRFSYIRSFDMNHVRCGDNVCHLDKTSPFMINFVLHNGDVVVSDDQCSLSREDKSHLKPYEKLMNSFFKNDRSDLYDVVYRKMVDFDFDHKLYFCIYCEYFKITDHEAFFDSLPKFHQDNIERMYRRRR